MVVSESQLKLVSAICRNSDILRLAIFGSRLSGVAAPDSDVDILVEFAPGRAPGFFGLARLASQLSEVFGGLPVDLRTPRDLSRSFRDEVIKTAEVLYAA